MFSPTGVVVVAEAVGEPKQFTIVNLNENRAAEVTKLLLTGQNENNKKGLPNITNSRTAARGTSTTTT
jgi:hypothetical protein